MTGRTKAMRMVVALACAAVLSACVAQYRNHGYLPSDSELAVVETFRVASKSPAGRARNAAMSSNSRTSLVADWPRNRR